MCSSRLWLVDSFVFDGFLMFVDSFALNGFLRSTDSFTDYGFLLVNDSFASSGFLISVDSLRGGGFLGLSDSFISDGFLINIDSFALYGFLLPIDSFYALASFFLASSANSASTHRTVAFASSFGSPAKPDASTPCSAIMQAKSYGVISSLIIMSTPSFPVHGINCGSNFS